MTPLEIFEVITATLTTVAAIVVANVAIQGLQSWRHELAGKNQYELAKRILIANDELTDAFETVRFPLIQYTSEDLLEMVADDAQRDFWQDTFQEFSKELDRTIHTLKPYLLEASLIWPEEEWSKHRSRISSLRAKWRVNVKRLLREGHKKKNSSTTCATGRIDEDVLIGSITDKRTENKFSGDLFDVLDSINKQAKRHLDEILNAKKTK